MTQRLYSSSVRACNAAELEKAQKGHKAEMEGFKGGVYGRLFHPGESECLWETIGDMLSASKDVDPRPVRHQIGNEEPAFGLFS